MRRRLLVIPSVRDLDSFTLLATNLAHYFGHLECERIVVPIETDLVQAASDWLERPVLPPGVDEVVRGRIEDVRGCLSLRSWPSSLEPPQLSSDMVLDWDTARTASEPWKSIRDSYRVHRTVFDVDWRGTRLGAAWFAEAAMILKRGRGFDAEGALGLLDLHQRIGQPARSFLIGTGPSARQALDFDMSDGLRIACNTVVLDDELMDHIRPHVLTFADPIFHFGPSSYAQSFQRAVVRSAQVHDFMVVTTERFAALLRDHRPELADRVIGVRQGKSTWVDNFDLIRNPAVRPYPNVLTMLMFPIAATYTKSIDLIGFDGRAPDEDYFWKHGSTVQFDRELDEIRLVHPGFFHVDYVDYYRNHVAQVERMCRRLEDRGVTVTPLTRSHMPPLRRRYPARPGTTHSTASPPGPVLVSLTPDWINEFGHFGPFERRLHEAAELVGLRHVAVASAGLHATEPWQLPMFTGFIATVLRGGGEFPLELDRALDTLDPSPGSIVAMYAGDAWHLPTVLDAALRWPKVQFTVNLMKSHDWIASALTEDNAWAQSLAELLSHCLDVAEGTNVKVTVDSEALVTDVERLVGRRLPMWPMVAISPRNLPEPRYERGPQDSIHVVSPVHAHMNKGFPEVAELSDRLRARIESSELQLTVRFAPQPVPVTVEVDALADTLVASGATIVRENLSDDEFTELIASADLVLIPYRLRPFRTRTSGVVLDALTAGKPVVTVRGTWAGDLVERYNAGLTYREGDSDEMEAAVLAVIRSLPEFEQQLRDSSSAINAEFATDRLIEFLCSESGTSRPTPSEEGVIRVKRQASQLREMYSWRASNDDLNRLSLAVNHDERARSVESGKDRIKELELALAWQRKRLRKAEDIRPPLKLDVAYPREARAHLDEVELVARLIDPDWNLPGHMVDVGAHHGSAMGHFLRRGWAITAFEPDVRHFGYLQDHFGNDERVVIDNRAVQAESSGPRPFFISQESTGVGALAPFLESHVEVDAVETVSLADALERGHVTVLKVDTEGFDLEVLRGFPWTRDTPDAVVCEFEDRKTTPLGYSTHDLGSFLVERGYQVFMSEWHPVIRYGQKHDWRRLVAYPSELLDPQAWGNFVAFKKPIPEGRIGKALAYCLRREESEEQLPGDGRLDTSDMIQPQRKKIGRRQAAVETLRGALRPAVAIGVAFAGSSGLLALLGRTQWAVIMGAAAIGASIVATVIVAVRVDRRSH